jgi:putative membrane protein
LTPRGAKWLLTAKKRSCESIKSCYTVVHHAAFHASRAKEYLMVLLLQWLLSAIALILVSKIVPGFRVAGIWPALIASLVIGLLNATVGLVLKIVTFPLSILTLGIFLLVINGLMILLAAALVPGFKVSGFTPAFLGAVVLALLGMVIRAIVKDA